MYKTRRLGGAKRNPMLQDIGLKNETQHPGQQTLNVGFRSAAPNLHN
ncbi:hypothetical protein H6F88_09900 [Oculatella sp. FACHB-28]|nr:MULTISPECIES: hypothetical protein [Cyanophyceae]MBD1866233.1 hypothetical protein [Cyanobacteria bacterium FACHB-471]MBD2056328.1 hypothetical protein [Oculatella sp. FACHB-28]MBD2070681.1 hypothetical protein [Leptolyngbya sp. FACHB-671]